jgi:TP901 family phage tail tape measure protein
MADLEKTVAIIFEGDDRIGKTVTNLGSQLDTIANKTATATQPLADLAESAIKLELALAGLVLGGLAFAVTKAGEFSDSFNEISTLFETSDENVNNFKEAIIDYSKTSTQSLDDINESVYNAISAGEDYTTALDLLREAEKLGIATKSTLNESISILKPTMNAFGVETDKAGDFADILFTTIATGKTTLGELEPVLANVTGIAAAGGVNFADLGAAIAGLTASGAPTNQAITQIKSALTNILAPTEAQTTEFLGNYLRQPVVTLRK